MVSKPKKHLIGKYGSFKSSKWSKGNEVLIVTPAHELPVGQGKPKVNVISVTLGAIENSAKKDI
jgi:hypothetical protein